MRSGPPRTFARTEARNGGPFISHASCWFRILASNRRVAYSDAVEHLPRVYSSILFGMLTAFSQVNSYMQFAVYDLLGALFAPSDPRPTSRHADKLFARIRGIIKDGFADPDFGPREAAAESGISLRYLQKLFTERGSTFGEFRYSFRLEHAARLLNRRASLRTSPRLSEIAFACGFRDYTHFARKFRHRFGCSPSAHFAAHAQRPGMSTNASASAPMGHDIQ
jgi:AraC family transcriptional regulator, positive regulator of tynA and feaB